MDPNECYKRMTSDTTDPREVLQSFVDLYEWLDSGGFRPEGVSRDEITDAMYSATSYAINELGYRMYEAKRSERPWEDGKPLEWVKQDVPRGWVCGDLIFDFFEYEEYYGAKLGILSSSYQRISDTCGVLNDQIEVPVKLYWITEGLVPEFLASPEFDCIAKQAYAFAAMESWERSYEALKCGWVEFLAFMIEKVRLAGGAEKVTMFRPHFIKMVDFCWGHAKLDMLADNRIASVCGDVFICPECGHRTPRIDDPMMCPHCEYPDHN